MENIILLGMSGAGKSTLGVLLAKIINKKFKDTDLIIQEKHKKLLHEIIKEEGLEKFKEYEEEVLLLLNESNTVIATGGSVIYSDLGMKKLKESGLIIYIHVPFQNISNRLHNITTRGIVMEEGQSLRDLYLEREPLYRKYADLIVEIVDEGVEDTLSKILKSIAYN